MDAEAGIVLIEYALGKEEDALIFSRWIHAAQYAMSFGDFKAALSRREKPTSVVMEDVGDILKAFEKER